MDFEDYKIRIQKIFDLLEHTKYPEDVLNSKELNLENDLQYMCMNSSINIELVNEVIARLAQNGNRTLVEKNIRNISMSMWKDLFNKNKIIKEIFINNFEYILENAGIMTYREIENFINDNETIDIVYENMEIIIKKLCTYDRASLIACIKTKGIDGVNIIRSHLEHLFQKGEYDISTTYSKILIELSNISEISKVEILEVCSKYLSDMLDRETAIDNETNDLLNWINDSMEETKMYKEQRAMLQENIDKAILDNFYSILDKANYDKETIKTLKQFPCTYEKFEKNKNLFIEKSNKLIHMTKIYDLNYEKENKSQDREEIMEEKGNNVINMENAVTKTNVNENNQNIKPENVLNEKIEEYSEKSDFDNYIYINNDMFNAANVDKNIDNDCNINKSNYEIANKTNFEEEFIGKHEISSSDKITSQMNDNQNLISEIKFEIGTFTQYADLLEQIGANEVKAEDVLSALIRSNIYEVNQIIDKVVRRDNSVLNKNIAQQEMYNQNVFNQDIQSIQKSQIPVEDHINIDYGAAENEVYTATTNEEIEGNIQNSNKITDTKIENNIDNINSYRCSRSINNNEALIKKEDSQVGFNKVVNLIKRLWKKIKELLSRFSADRIGE